MLDYLNDKKRQIISHLSSWFQPETRFGSRLSSINADVTSKLISYSSRGKMIRGGLVFLGYELFGGTATLDITAVAAAMEIFQSALLIHDDIMDRDDLRRGEKTIHRLFALEAAKNKLADPEHIGSALGICAGDLAFFYAFRMISESKLKAKLIVKLQSLFSRELSLVGIAQMQDVMIGAEDFKNHIPNETEILELYRYKTGRYTFSLPLMTGALSAGANAAEISLLEQFGEKLGIIFQIKDDEIGLFGEEDTTGKPVGSDLREGKKTLVLSYLLSRVDGDERENILSILLDKRGSSRDIAQIQKLFLEKNIKHEIDDLLSRLAQDSRELIKQILKSTKQHGEILQSLLDYSLNRVF